MENERIIKSLWPLKDKIGMILSNNIDYGNENGGLISVRKFDSISNDIIQLMDYQNKQIEEIRKIINNSIYLDSGNRDLMNSIGEIANILKIDIESINGLL